MTALTSLEQAVVVELLGAEIAEADAEAIEAAVSGLRADTAAFRADALAFLAAVSDMPESPGND